MDHTESQSFISNIWKNSNPLKNQRRQSCAFIYAKSHTRGGGLVRNDAKLSNFVSKCVNHAHVNPDAPITSKGPMWQPKEYLRVIGASGFFLD